MNTDSSNSELRKERENVTCERIVISDFSDNYDMALLRQDVTTIYPAVGASNNKAGVLFNADDFGDGNEYTQKRYTLIKVPKGITAEKVEDQLKALRDSGKRPTIYKILSNDIMDVLTDNQIYAIENGLGEMDYDDYKEKNIVRNSEEEVVTDPWGATQYSEKFFQPDFKEDIDLRVKEGTRVSVADSADVHDDKVENFIANPENVSEKEAF